MKRIALLLFLFALPAFAQNIRWDSQTTTTTGTGQMLPVLALPNSQVNFFINCTTLPCTTPATTYQSATSATACPSNAQVVWQSPSGTGCQAVSDSQGNFGGWFAAGAYQYVVQVSGITAGPYQFNVGGGGGGGSSFNGGTISGALFGPNINGEIYPASCGSSNPPSWCAGSTADAWIRAACTQLPAKGGIINLLGLNGTLAASAPCSTPTKQVIILADNTSLLTVTEADGAITFPLDNGSMLLGYGAGQCILGSLVNPIAGIHLASTANLTSIVGPAHTDGTQEALTVQGVCMWGNTGATVSKGLMYSKATFVNTTFSDNNASVCDTSCLWLENIGGMATVRNNEFNGTSGVYTITTSPLVIASTGGAGCEAQSIDVSGGNEEHANGGGQHEINVIGNGGGAEACGLYVHDTYVEKNVLGTPSTSAIAVQDCLNCSFSNIEGGGGNSTSGDMINLSASSPTRVQNVNFYNIGNVFNSWTNTINDTTSGGSVLPLSTYPSVTSYYSNPGYVQPPVLPGSTIQAVTADLMNGDGSFATGDANFGTNFHDTGCIGTVSCTYTRTASSPPPGYAESQQVQITANTDLSSGYNGVEYVPSTSFVAGQTYIASFWGKGDGTFTGFPEFLLWVSTTPAFYCQSTVATPFTTTWTLYAFQCKPTVSGSAHLAIAARTPAGATGTFSLGGFNFNPVSQLTPGNILTSLSPYGIGAATDAQKTVTINSIPCELGGSCSVTAPGVSSINSTAGAFTFSFSGGAGSCSGTTCTFTGSGSGGGSVTNFIAGTWPSWLTPTVTLSTTTPTLAVAASAIPNSALANPTFTLGSTVVTLGGTTATLAGITLTNPTFSAGGAFGTPASLTLTNATGLPWAALTGSPSTTQVPVQSLTTTGTSGPATLASGVLNIPQYAVGSTNTICSGTIPLGTSAIASGTAATTITQTCTGLASTDNIMLDFNGSPLGTVGYQPSTSGMLTIIKWPTTNTINISVVNSTGSSITPGAVTVNYRVVR